MFGKVERQGQELPAVRGRNVSGPSWPTARITASVDSISSATVSGETKTIRRWLNV